MGRYCPEGTSYPLECPAGTYNNLTGQAECWECPAGYFCPDNITTYENYPCPEGYYCPNGTRFSSEYPCPTGHYRNASLGQSVDDCYLCPGGQYCGQEGLPNPSGPCDEGRLPYPLLICVCHREVVSQSAVSLFIKFG